MGLVIDLSVVMCGRSDLKKKRMVGFKSGLWNLNPLDCCPSIFKIKIIIKFLNTNEEVLNVLKYGSILVAMFS